MWPFSYFKKKAEAKRKAELVLEELAAAERLAMMKRVARSLRNVEVTAGRAVNLNVLGDPTPRKIVTELGSPMFYASTYDASACGDCDNCESTCK